MECGHELILIPSILCQVCKIRLKQNFSPYLFKKKYSDKEKKSGELWARPLLDAPKCSMPLEVYPSGTFNSFSLLSDSGDAVSPLLPSDTLKYDVEKLARIAYAFSRRSTSEIGFFVDYAARPDANPRVLRQCVTWHFDYHFILYFSLLPEFYDNALTPSRKRIYHEVIERGVWRDKVAAFICTMHEDKFSSVEDACMRMLTRESYWRCGAFGRDYEPPRYNISHAT
jgi:hypothetical protein